MFSWDLVLTSLVIAIAAGYVINNIYKTITNATSGCSGCCSACSHCGISGHNTESIGDKMAQAIAQAQQQK